jgi:RNA polymerase sigma-70 factor, ECF subfamily
VKQKRDLPDETDIDIDAILEGDQKAFEALVRQESPRLYRLLVGMLQDEDEARSVLQETFLQAYENLGSFCRDSRLTTWLYGIALNQGRAARRKRRREQVMEEKDIERLQPGFRMGMYTRTIPSWDPERVAEKNDRMALVRKAIAALPDPYREVIELRDMNEFSTTEAAELLGISEGTLRVRLHRARQALRALLEDHFRT